jgi:putative ABC transport system permease protein
MGIGTLVESTVWNLRQAGRTLSKTPVFTASVVLTLALGIGASSAVFSVVDAVLLRSLPFPDGDQLVQISQAQPKITEPAVAPVRLLDWNRLNSSFQIISGYYTNDVSETSSELPEKLTEALVAPGFLRVWRVAPALGRDFTREEEHFGGPLVVLISDRLWRRRFDGDPNVLGKAVHIGNSACAIVGVMPRDFAFPVRDTDLWAPSAMDAPFAQSRESTWFTTIGRLKPGVSLVQARADLETVQAGLGREYPKTDAEIKPRLESLKEVTTGGVRKSLWILFGSVTLLLLIACVNIAALLLSRAAARRHELTVRFSLGASRTSVAVACLTEVFLLAVAGAVAGLAIAAGASAVFRTLAAAFPRIDEIGLNLRVVLYSFACAVVVTLLSGVLPAVRSTKLNLASSLAQGGRTQVSGRHPVQLVLVGVQVALAVTLLSGAGLLVRSLQELGRVSPGFDPAGVLTFHISTNWGETADRPGSRQRLERILDAVRSLSGVESAAAAIELPGVPAAFQVEVTTEAGRAETETKMLTEGRWVTPAYFSVMRIPMVAGELCRDAPGVPTAMVNRSFANAYLQGNGAVGQRLLLSTIPGLAPARITGIVGDARETGLDRRPVPTVYWCSGGLQPGTFFLARTRVEPAAMAEPVRRRLRQVEPARSVYDLSPLADHISKAYGENRLRTILFAFFALSAISLASIGLYGTLSYLVHVRRRELALRMALGAVRVQVLRQVFAQGLRVSLLGCLAGLLLSAALSRVLLGVLFGVSASDPATLAAVVVVVATVSSAASLLPAIRASRLDPMRALREE